MALAVQTQHEQPLIAVEVPEGRVRYGITSQIALGSGHKLRRARPRLLEFREQLSRVRPLPNGSHRFRSLPAGSPIGNHLCDNTILFEGRVFRRFRWTFELLSDQAEDAAFDAHDMLQALRDRPSPFRRLETPL